MSVSTSIPPHQEPGYPVVEVVLGVHFAPLLSLMAPHLGRYWETIRAEYPLISEAPPLAPVPDAASTEGAAPNQVIEEFDSSFRAWFHDTEPPRSLIQVQRDRFICNWKDREYPRFDRLRAKFFTEWRRFQEFLAATIPDPIVLRQFEFTYVNEWGNELGWSDLADNPNKLPGLFATDMKAQPDQQRVEARVIYDEPTLGGQIRAVVRSPAEQVPSGRPVLQLGITAQGFLKDRPEPDSWFDVAHDRLKLRFNQLSGKEKS